VRSIVKAHVDAGARISAPTHAGRRGHPLLFARALVPELRAISEETMGVRAVVRRHAAAINGVAVDDPIVLLDLNTPADARAGATLPEA
jgi:CTP:molybdopterin cytidylyltransferase MocA